MSASELGPGDWVTWSRAEIHRVAKQHSISGKVYYMDSRRLRVAPFGTVTGPSEIVIELVEIDWDKIAEVHCAEETLRGVGDKRMRERVFHKESRFLKVIARFKVLIEEVELDEPRTDRS